MADRIVVLEQGKIVEVGTHQELMKLGGLYHQMFVLQAASYQSDLD
jgi:ATP-binding cassette subfamily B protein